jgi:hypothetical protein
MLKTSFTVRMKLRLKGRCSKHPRYNPEQGEGVIRGGCSQCLALYQVIAARDRANAALKVLEDLATPYQVPRKTPMLRTVATTTAVAKQPRSSRF